jgi:hypothetical protein
LCTAGKKHGIIYPYYEENEMSRMSQMVLEIEEQLIEGLLPREVADRLSVPLDWVVGVEQELVLGDRAYGSDYDQE